MIDTQGRSNLLDDKIVALLFFEPSSRTMLSFQSAAQRLKAGTVFAQSSSSTSFEKGESILFYNLLCIFTQLGGNRDERTSQRQHLTINIL